MLKRVILAKKRFSDYRRVIEPKLYNEVLALAKKLKNKRVLHINSNSVQGGIAQTLQNVIPLLKSVGVKAEWHVIEKIPNNLYNITKLIHNGLQGDKPNLSGRQWRLYENFNRKLAKHVDGRKWDYIFVHDTQPAAMLAAVKDRGSAKWLWRCHIDTTKPNPSYQKRYLRYARVYDGVIFIMRKFIFKNLNPKNLLTSPLAIDPIATKNLPMDKTQALRTVAKFGIDTKRPFITQVSRIDPWKDPVGVLRAFRLAKKYLPELQLVFVGSFRTSSGQGKRLLSAIKKAARGLKDFYLIVNQANEVETRSFVAANNITLQKSTREGFGLTVSEALWQKVPVIGGNVGGIKLQIINGKTGYLVTTPKECARRIIELIQNPKKARQFGRRGREHVRQKFLLPRLIRDELQFMLKLKDQPPSTAAR